MNLSGVYHMNPARLRSTTLADPSMTGAANGFDIKLLKIPLKLRISNKWDRTEREQFRDGTQMSTLELNLHKKHQNHLSSSFQKDLSTPPTSVNSFQVFMLWFGSLLHTFIIAVHNDLSL